VDPEGIKFTLMDIAGNFGLPKKSKLRIKLLLMLLYEKERLIYLGSNLKKKMMMLVLLFRFAVLK
jgi:hypothetical protein